MLPQGLNPGVTQEVLRNRLSKEEFERVMRESYRTLISFRAKTKKGQAVKSSTQEDDEIERKENLKKKYAKFTAQVLTQHQQ